MKEIPFTTSTSRELEGGGVVVGGRSLGPFRCAVSVLLGAGLGMGLSFFVNVALIEISINPLFRLYFGVVLIVLGCVLMVRGARAQGSMRSSPRKWFAMALSLSVVASGIVALLFQADWLLKGRGFFKVLLYSWMATSLTFATSITMLDMFAFVHDVSVRMAWGKAEAGPSLFSSPAQVVLVVMVSLMLGLAYGVVFGLVNVGYGVVNAEQLVQQLRTDEYIALPVGCAIGVMGALANELLRLAQVESTAADAYGTGAFGHDRYEKVAKNDDGM